MSSTTLAHRESLVAALAARRLDRTLTTALPHADQYDEATTGATGLDTWDAHLAGGFPRGQVSEIVGPASSGRTSVLLRMMAAATARGELVALVDALDRLDPESAAAANVDLERLLWIRGHVVSNPGFCRDVVPHALEQAIKALTLVLQAGNFGVVALDISDAPADALRRLPFTTWMRLQRIVEGQPTVCVLLGSEPIARSAAGLSIVLQRRSGQQEGGRFRGGLFDGLDLTARIVRARIRAHEDRVVSFSTTAAHHG